ncbi:unnamed protein product, partial [Rotaria magnacalcarata]
YFKISPEYQPNVSATYLCSFYDISNSCWNETGCTGALFNPVFSRYECSCNHLTAFAITWSAASVSDTTNNLISTNPVTRIDIDTSFESTSSTLTSLSSGNSTSSVTLATGIASTTEEVTNIVSTIKSSTVSSTGTTVASSTANSTATTVASSTANSTATTVASSTANSTATMMASSTTNNIATTINSRDNTTELVSSVQSTSSSTTTNITGTAARTGSITTVLITSVQSTASSTTANLVLSTVTSVSANVSTLTASSTGQSMSSNSVLSAFSSAPLTTISTSVASSSLFTTAATITTTISTYSPDTCRNSSNVALPNGTCVPYNVGQEYSAGILNSGNASSVDLANSLSLYVASINNANASSGGNSTVSISKIEQSLSKLDNISITLSSDSSFLIAQPLNHSSNDILLGARFQRGLNGSAVTISTENSSLNSNATAAAVISEQSLVNVKSLQMFIIDKPTMYENADNKTNKSLASSVVVGSVQLLGSASVSLNISLYFKISPEYQPN